MSFPGLINSSSELSFLLLCFIRKTDLGRRGLWACWIIPSIIITYNWFMKRSCLFSICLPCSCLLTSIRIFALKFFFSDMVHRFHWDHLEKMHFEISFNLFLHNVGIPGPSQTLWNFQKNFMGLSWRHGPQNNLSKKHFQNEETRNGHL